MATKDWNSSLFKSLAVLHKDMNNICKLIDENYNLYSMGSNNVTIF